MALTPSRTRYCPHLLCRPVHAAAVLLAGGSVLAAVLTSFAALAAVVVLGALVTVVLRLVTTANPSAEVSTTVAVREAWAYAAVGADIALVVWAAVVSRTAFHRPRAFARFLALDWSIRSAVLVACVTVGALLWQTFHLMALRSAR
ncbi:hypothetical protein ACFZAM_31720 [Streptomyces sp. NPDC008079]|uniref:hypothetical protein n=1 Tax=Streptomyces sp. NPDC008079 TaxID=3364806 RepID=UPI0036E0FB32